MAVHSREVAAGRAHVEESEHGVVQVLRLEAEGDGVERRDVFRADDRVVGHVAEEGDLVALALGELLRARAADDDVGLDADVTQRATLCWVGLVLSSPAASM
jgi:predicted RNA-binding protein